MGRLDGKVAIVTGAGGGIGGAATKLFVQEGAKVCLVDLQEGPASELAASLGDAAFFKKADVSNEEQVKEYIQACVDRFGGLDIIFLNAGIEGKYTPFLEYSSSTFELVMKVNVLGVFLGIKHSTPVLTQRGGGSIIVTSSIAGMSSSPGLAAYSPTKHAVLGLVRTAAQELGPQNIRVNAINPGPIDNRMTKEVEAQVLPQAPELARKAYQSIIPMRRYGRNEEVAQMALFLASQESSFSTGSTFVLDGGVLST